MDKPTIEWTTGHEHCHRCGVVHDCLVRWTMGRKRALCRECLPLDGEMHGDAAALLQADFERTIAAARAEAARTGKPVFPFGPPILDD